MMWAARYCLLIFAMFLSSLGFAQTSRLNTPDDALLAIHIRNVPNTLNQWHASPLYRMWIDPRFSAFFRPSRDRLDAVMARLQEATGASWDETKALFSGEAVFFCNYGAMGGKPRLHWAMAAKVGNSGKALAWAEKIASRDLALDVPTQKQTSGNYVIFGKFNRKIAMAAIPQVQPKGKKKKRQAADEELVDSDPLELPVASGGEGEATQWEWCISGDMLYLSQASEPELGKWLNGSGLKPAPAATSGDWDLEVTANVSKALSGQNSVLALPASLKPLRLDEIRSLAIGANLSPSSLTFGLDLQSIPEPKGAAAVFVDQKSNALKTAAYVPSDASSFATFIVEPGKIIDLANLCIASTKNGQKTGDILAQVSQLAKVDVNALLRKISGESAVFSRPVAGKPGMPLELKTTILLGVNDEGGVAEGVARLAEAYLATGANGRKMVAHDYKSFAIYALQPIGATTATQPAAINSNLRTSISFAVAKRYIILSNDTEQVRCVLNLMKGEGQSIANNPQLRQKFQSAGANLRGFAWRNQSMTMQDAARALSTPLAIWIPLAPYVRLTAMPSPETVGKFFGEQASWSESTGSAYHFRTRMEYPQGLAAKPK